MKLNEERLNAIKSAINKWLLDSSGKPIDEVLTPFCMEMTDEEISDEVKLEVRNDSFYADGYADGFCDGAKFIRDGNK